MYVNYYSYLNPNDTKHTLEEQKKYYRGRIATKVVQSTDQSDIVRRKTQYLLGVVSSITSQRDFRLLTANNTSFAEHYDQYEIPKRSGGTRTIRAPHEDLKVLQQNLLRRLEKTKCLPNNCVHSFLSYRNCKTALEVHQANHSRWFLKVDIHDYFGSITLGQFLEVLMQVYPFTYLHPNTMETIFNLCFINKELLPQGAPASPWISNMYLTIFDYDLQQTLGDDFIVTRYADDILISSRKKFAFDKVVRQVSRLLSPYGLTLNARKTRFGSCNGANWNLGLMYNKDHNITVGYKRKHIFKCMLHNLKKIEDRTTSDYWDKWYHLQGLLAYYQHIEPTYFTKYKESLMDIEPKIKPVKA